MMINNRLFFLLICFVLLSCKDYRRNKFELYRIFIADSVQIDIPKNWTVIDTSFIVSDGLVSSKSYYSMDSSEVGIFSILNYQNSNISFSFDQLSERAKASINFFVNSKSIRIMPQKVTSRGYQTRVIQANYYDSKVNKYISLCEIIISIMRDEYVTISLRIMGEKEEEVSSKINAIVKSI